MKETNIGVIGCGNMGSAIVQGIVNNAVVDKDRLFLYDRDIHKAQCLADESGAHIRDLKTLLEGSGIIVLAVKPQDSEGLFREIAPYIEGKTLVSIMAGVKIDHITSALGCQLPVARVMPNLAAFVSESMTCIACNELVKDREAIEEIFLSVGRVAEVSEEQMDAVTAVSGSGPAYLFYLADAMVKAAMASGLSEGLAGKLVKQTIAGASLFMAGSERGPGELTGQVASKGGTTEAALSVFEEEGVGETIKRAVLAAKKRSEQLSGG